MLRLFVKKNLKVFPLRFILKLKKNNNSPVFLIYFSFHKKIFAVKLKYDCCDSILTELCVTVVRGNNACRFLQEKMRIFLNFKTGSLQKINLKILYLPINFHFKVCWNVKSMVHKSSRKVTYIFFSCF